MERRTDIEPIMDECLPVIDDLGAKHRSTIDMFLHAHQGWTGTENQHLGLIQDTDQHTVLSLEGSSQHPNISYLYHTS